MSDIVKDSLPAIPETAFGDSGAETGPAHKQKTRIQITNEAKILEAALEVFSKDGFRGATLDRIASAAEMSKPNLLYLSLIHI